MSTQLHQAARSRRTLAHKEAGGITILVVLSLLVLLTVAAIGMSRNSLREIMVAGTVRQGAEVVNTADAGLEWAMFWMYPPNASGGSPSASANAFLAVLDKLQKDTTLVGQPQVLAATGSEMIYTNTNGATRQFGLQVTQMGQVSPPGFSVQNQSLWPLAWNVRSDAAVNYPSGPTFQHSREMWVTTPVSQVNN